MPENLLKIPAYFYHSDAKPFVDRMAKQNPLQYLHYDLSRRYDLDLTLLTYARFLSKVHGEFFENFEAKANLPKLLDVKYYINKCKQSIFADFSTEKKLNLTMFCLKKE